MYKLILGDCLEKLKEIPDNSVDLIITSPPYNLSMYDRKSGDVIVKYRTYKDNLPYDVYIAWQIDVLNECYRILKDTGVIYYNHKERHIDGYYYNPLLTFSKSNFKILQTIIWDRFGGVNFNIGRYVNCYEQIIVGYKTDSYMQINKKYEKLLDIWRINPDKNSYQVAAFPLELPYRIIKGYDYMSDLVVLDPFMGSATTGIACIKNKRSFIGIEIDENNYRVAKERSERELKKPLKRKLI